MLISAKTTQLISLFFFTKKKCNDYLGNYKNIQPVIFVALKMAELINNYINNDTNNSIIFGMNDNRNNNNTINDNSIKATFISKALIIVKDTLCAFPSFLVIQMFGKLVRPLGFVSDTYLATISSSYLLKD